MTEVLSFTEALEASAEVKGKQHLLLGNGFSIACRPDAFSYGNLFEEADFSALGVDAESLFRLFGTADFERVIEALRTSEEILVLYGVDSDTAALLGSDAAALKDALAEVLARQHPDNVASIKPEEYAAARSFLANFDGRIYTVSYDLLLYWTLLQDQGPKVAHDDGFRADRDEPEAEWVVWDGFADYDQRIYFLHGGLHLYDSGSQLQKITWARTGIPLVDQIRDALAANVYPHVVTEGTSEQKLRRIEHSPYLHRGLKSLKACQGSLFIHGHSLDPNDEHVLRRIEDSKVEAIFISLHGSPDSEGNQKIIQRAEIMAERRAENEAPKPSKKRRHLEVAFYDADSAAVWNSQ
jgi:hypothetical protein